MLAIPAESDNFRLFVVTLGFLAGLFGGTLHGAT